MSTPFKTPLILAGTARFSGDLSTDEVNFTRGGVRTACVYSGAIAMGTTACPAGAIASGGSILITSGAGRLNTFTPLFPAGVALAGNGETGVVSGQAIVVYDSAITARSGIFTDGTIGESGRKILYSWYPPRLQSGAANSLGGFNPIPLEVPFQSGLCVMALSGATGFNVSYTLE